MNIKAVIPILIGLFTGCALAGIYIALPIIFALGIIAWARYSIRLKQYENNVVETEIIKREPIMENRSEKVGSSITYGRTISYHEHFKDVTVQVGEKVTFRVKWNNGKVSNITCKGGDATYTRLREKAKK
jgi:hypothetical protein